MAKICLYDGCNNPVWSKGYCKWHQWIVKPPKSIAKVGSKKAKDKRAYLILNRQFLADKKKCAAKLKGCQVRSSQVHHIKGCGKYFLVVETWLPICDNCHDIIHNKMSMDEAVKRGLRVKQN